MPSDRDRDTTGSPWSSPDVQNEGGPGFPVPLAPIPAESSERLAAAEGTAPSGGEAVSTGSMLRQIVSVFIENKLAVIGLAVIVFMVLFCWLGPVFYHTNQTNAQEALVNSTSNASPNGQHLLGTDNAGFDILGRLMFGGKNSLMVGLSAAILGTAWGALYGAVSGFFGGWVDALMMRIVDTLLSIPLLFLLIVLAVIFHPTLDGVDPRHRLRVVARSRPAHPGRDPDLARPGIRAGGPGHGRQPATDRPPPHPAQRHRHHHRQCHLPGGRRHLVPGLPGVPRSRGATPPDRLGIDALQRRQLTPSQGYWWEIYPAGLAIVLVVVAFNFIGDALRDSLEVRLQQR